ncbi:MAG: hypothetical protein C0501_31015 [Isosphaera sp.]|nr:hypothetical protein [Isosphaera sp.]
MTRSLWFPLTVGLIVGLWAYTRFGPAPDHGMPAGVGGAEERELYLLPGGLCTTVAGFGSEVAVSR